MLQAKVAAVFSFRGSQPYQLKDWLLDISFLPTPVGWAPGCRAHAGFLRAFNSVSVTPETATKQGVQQVLQDLIDRYNLGHKNGSSLAVSKLTRCAGCTRVLQHGLAVWMGDDSYVSFTATQAHLHWT